MFGFRPDLDRFPKLLDQGLSKREIAERATDPAHFKLIRAAYEVHPKKMERLSALYFIEAEGHSVCKIGIAHDPFVRLKGIQTGCWAELHIRALFWYPHINNAQSHEFAALKFAKQNGLRLKGEWVDLAYMEAIGLALSASTADRRFTDNYGLIHEWFVDMHQQEIDDEERMFAQSKARRAAA